MAGDDRRVVPMRQNHMTEGTMVPTPEFKERGYSAVDVIPCIPEGYFALRTFQRNRERLRSMADQNRFEIRSRTQAARGRPGVTGMAILHCNFETHQRIARKQTKVMQTPHGSGHGHNVWRGATTMNQ